LPAAPETVAAYLATLARTHTSSALIRRLAALSRAHRLARQPWPVADPAIRNTLRGIQRRYGRPVRQAAALATEEIRRLVETCPATPVGQRDRALLLIGYAAALRRSELVAITREHITFDKDGIRRHRQLVVDEIAKGAPG
jgi:integrase